MSKEEDRYVAQITEMTHKARAWIAAHPELSPKVQFNFAEDVLRIFPLSEAIEMGAIAVDDAGRELLTAMQEGIPERLEPTPGMIRMALEFINDERV